MTAAPAAASTKLGFVKVCMFVKNSFEYDARVTREATSLIAAGHDVTVVAIHAPGATVESEVTANGIRVRRVSRVQFGVSALNRLAARYAGKVEQRHSRLTGAPVDEDLALQLGTLQPASTATPGDAVEVDIGHSEPPADPGGIRRAWGRLTTPVLRFGSRAARVGFRSVKFVLGRQGRALKTWAINRRMFAEGIRTQADVFHCHDLNTLYVGNRLKRATGKPVVYDSHELATERNRMGFWWRRWARWSERRWIRHADRIIVASPYWVRFLSDAYPGIPRPETVLNVPERIEMEPGWDLRSTLAISDAQRIVVYQGSIQENRGIEPAIEALTGLEDTVLVIIGYGYHRPALETLVRKRKLADRVRFFGPLPNRELLFYTASADIGLCNIVNSSLSYYTTLPNKLFEYMLAGIPVIGSDSPEIGRVVTEEQIGVTCDPEDPEALAAAARSILDHPEAAARFRKNTRRALHRYNWEVEQQTLLELYDEVETKGR